MYSIFRQRRFTRRLIALVVASVFFINDFSWAIDIRPAPRSTLAIPSQLTENSFKERFLAREFALSAEGADRYISEQIDLERDIIRESKGSWEDERTKAINVRGYVSRDGKIRNNVPGLDTIKLIKVTGVLPKTGQFAKVDLTGKYDPLPVMKIDSSFYNWFDNALQKHEIEEIIQWEDLRVNILGISGLANMEAWQDKNIDELSADAREKLAGTIYESCNSSRDIALLIHSRSHSLDQLYAYKAKQLGEIGVRAAFDFEKLSALFNFYNTGKSKKLNIAAADKIKWTGPQDLSSARNKTSAETAQSSAEAVSRRTGIDADDWYIRELAFAWFADERKKDALPTLYERLKTEPRSEVRKAIIDGIGRYGDESSLGILKERVYSGDASDAIASLGAIGSIGGYKAANMLIDFDARILSSEKPVFQTEAQASLARQAIYKALGSSRSPVAPGYLLAILQDKSRLGNWADAAKALGIAKDAESVPTLLERIKDKNFWVRHNSIAALGAIGDVSALPELERLKQDGNENIRQAAKESIANIENINIGSRGGAESIAPSAPANEDAGKTGAVPILPGAVTSDRAVNIKDVDIEQIKSIARSFNLSTCLANSALISYILRALGESAALIGMFRKNEDIPFHYLVSTEKWGEIDLRPYDDEADDYERTAEASLADYEMGLLTLRTGGFLDYADCMLADGAFRSLPMGGSVSLGATSPAQDDSASGPSDRIAGAMAEFKPQPAAADKTKTASSAGEIRSQHDIWRGIIKRNQDKFYNCAPIGKDEIDGALRYLEADPEIGLKVDYSSLVFARAPPELFDRIEEEFFWLTGKAVELSSFNFKSRRGHVVIIKDGLSENEFIDALSRQIGAVQYRLPHDYCLYLKELAMGHIITDSAYDLLIETIGLNRAAMMLRGRVPVLVPITESATPAQRPIYEPGQWVRSVVPGENQGQAYRVREFSSYTGRLILERKHLLMDRDRHLTTMLKEVQLGGPRRDHWPYYEAIILPPTNDHGPLRFAFLLDWKIRRVITRLNRYEQKVARAKKDRQYNHDLHIDKKIAQARYDLYDLCRMRASPRRTAAPENGDNLKGLPAVAKVGSALAKTGDTLQAQTGVVITKDIGDIGVRSERDRPDHHTPELPSMKSELSPRDLTPKSPKSQYHPPFGLVPMDADSTIEALGLGRRGDTLSPRQLYDIGFHIMRDDIFIIDANTGGKIPVVSMQKPRPDGTAAGRVVMSTGENIIAGFVYSPSFDDGLFATTYITHLSVDIPYRHNADGGRIGRMAGARLMQAAAEIGVRDSDSDIAFKLSSHNESDVQNFYKEFERFGLKPKPLGDGDIEWSLDMSDAKNFISGIENWITGEVSEGSVSSGATRQASDTDKPSTRIKGAMAEPEKPKAAEPGKQIPAPIVDRYFKVEVLIDQSYPVMLTRGVFAIDNRILAQQIDNKKTLFIIDSGVAPYVEQEIKLYAKKHNIDAYIFIVPGGEESKEYTTYVDEVFKKAEKVGIDRKQMIVIVGGGAVTDMGGFAASILHRGVEHIRVPTTLLSQIDAAVGSKNAVNFLEQKNMVGVFQPPKCVIVDPELLGTLNERQMRSGLAEAIKVAIMKDGEFFKLLEKHFQDVLDKNFSAESRAEEIMWTTITLHLEQIKTDPYEKEFARPLDFGHEWGHRLESVTHYRLTHGEGVSIGMAIDSVVSYKRGYITENDLKRILNLIELSGLPIVDQAVTIENIWPGLESFRRHLGGKLTIPLIYEKIGLVKDVHRISKQEVRSAIEHLRNRAAGNSETEALSESVSDLSSENAPSAPQTAKPSSRIQGAMAEPEKPAVEENGTVPIYTSGFDRARSIFGERVIGAASDLDRGFQQYVENFRRSQIPQSPETVSRSWEWEPSYLKALASLRCTASCDHCCFACGPALRQDLNMAQLERIFDVGEVFYSHPINEITGGELLLRRDLPDILRSFSIDTLITNASTVTSLRKANEIIETLIGALGRKTRFTLVISLDDLHMRQRAVSARKIALLMQAACMRHPRIKLGIITLKDNWLKAFSGVRMELAKNGYALYHFDNYFMMETPATKSVRIGLQQNSLDRVGNAFFYLPNEYFAETKPPETLLGYSGYEGLFMDSSGNATFSDYFSSGHAPLLFGNVLEEGWGALMRRAERDALFRGFVDEPYWRTDGSRIFEMIRFAEEYHPGITEEILKGRPGSINAFLYWIFSHPERKLYIHYRLAQEFSRRGLAGFQGPVDGVSVEGLKGMVHRQVEYLRRQYASVVSPLISANRDIPRTDGRIVGAMAEPEKPAVEEKRTVPIFTDGEGGVQAEIANDTNISAESSDSLQALSSEDGQKAAAVLRDVIDEVQFDYFNKLLRDELYGKEPVPNKRAHIEKIRQEIQSASGLEADIRRGAEAFAFFMFGDAVDKKQLERIVGESRKGCIDDLLKLGICVTSLDGKIRMNGLSLISKELKGGEILYVFADTPPVFDAASAGENVYIGSDSYRLLDRLQRIDNVFGVAADMGTGSGIQLIAALKLFPGIHKGIGLENNERAINVCRFNTYLNGVADRAVVVRDGDGLRRVLAGDRIKLVVSNPPFLSMPDMIRVDADKERLLSSALPLVEKNGVSFISIRQIYPSCGWGGPDGLTVTREFLDIVLPLLDDVAQIIIYSQFGFNDHGVARISEYINSRKGLGFDFEPLSDYMISIDDAADALLYLILMHNPKLGEDNLRPVRKMLRNNIADAILQNGISHLLDGYAVINYNEKSDSHFSGQASSRVDTAEDVILDSAMPEAEKLAGDGNSAAPIFIEENWLQTVVGALFPELVRKLYEEDRFYAISELERVLSCRAFILTPYLNALAGRLELLEVGFAEGEISYRLTQTARRNTPDIIALFEEVLLRCDLYPGDILRLEAIKRATAIVAERETTPKLAVEGSGSVSSGATRDAPTIAPEVAKSSARIHDTTIQGRSEPENSRVFPSRTSVETVETLQTETVSDFDVPANIGEALKVLDGTAAKNLDDGQIYEIRYDKRRFAEAGYDDENSALAALKTYAVALRMRAGKKWRDKIRLIEFNGESDSNGRLISVDRYAGLGESRPIGTSQIDVSESISKKPIDVVMMLNMAIIACEIPESVSAENAKRDHRGILERIEVLYNTLSDTPFDMNNPVFRRIKLTLPSASMLSTDALHDYYRLTIEALRKYA